MKTTKAEIDSNLPLRHGRTRRDFLGTLAVSGAAGAMLATTPPPLLAAGSRGRLPKVALLATEVRKYSHAQHFVDRFLEGYGWEGRHHRPPFELAALYVDQIPDGDLSRAGSRRTV